MQPRIVIRENVQCDIDQIGPLCVEAPCLANGHESSETDSFQAPPNGSPGCTGWLPSYVDQYVLKKETDCIDDLTLNLTLRKPSRFVGSLVGRNMLGRRNDITLIYIENIL